MGKIVFVVLHYKNNKITEDCVEYLLGQDYTDYSIIIVDNFSNNNSYESLQKKYKNNDCIFMVSLAHNLGFAKANNIGYSIAKYKYDSKCTVIINNDLMITDKNFCNKLENISKTIPYDILGPDIITKEGVHQNPLKGCITNRKDLEKRLFGINIKLLTFPLLYSVYKTLKGAKKEDSCSSPTTIPLKNVPLHGSCIIFSSNFINNHEFAFYPETFLYGEEDILYCLAMKEKLNLLYHPGLRVYHMEDVATSEVFKKQKSRRLFQLKETKKSLNILKKIIGEKRV